LRSEASDGVLQVLCGYNGASPSELIDCQTDLPEASLYEPVLHLVRRPGLAAVSSVARRLIAEVASKQRAAGLQPPGRVAFGEGFPASLVRAATRKPRDHPSRRTSSWP
jgi:hypothetical protein